MNASGGFRATTILAVIRDGRLVMGADGQVTNGDQIIKHGARKLRRLFNDRALGGFAGHTADALTLFERFESKLEAVPGSLKRAAVDLAKEWRTDRALRRLDALLLVGDTEQILMLSGQGDVVEPDEPIAAIGSGAPAALAAAKALWRHTSLSAEEIVKHAMTIASEQCIYTNDRIIVETIKR